MLDMGEVGGERDAWGDLREAQVRTRGGSGGRWKCLGLLWFV